MYRDCCSCFFCSSLAWIPCLSMLPYVALDGGSERWDHSPDARTATVRIAARSAARSGSDARSAQRAVAYRTETFNRAVTSYRYYSYGGSFIFYLLQWCVVPQLRAATHLMRASPKLCAHRGYGWDGPEPFGAFLSEFVCSWGSRVYLTAAGMVDCVGARRGLSVLRGCTRLLGSRVFTIPDQLELLLGALAHGGGGLVGFTGGNGGKWSEFLLEGCAGLDALWVAWGNIFSSNLIIFLNLIIYFSWGSDIFLVRQFSWGVW